MPNQPATPCPNCKPCSWCGGTAKWDLNGEEVDCYGCSFDGIEEHCEKHKEPE